MANWKDGGAARKDLAAKGPDGGLVDHPDRPRLALLRRARRRAHEARPAAARSGGGARLLLRQHPQQPLLRRGRHGGDLERQIHAHRRLASSKARRSAPMPTAKAPEAAARADEAFEATLAKMQVLKDTADSGKMAYDQMIGADNRGGQQDRPGRGRQPRRAGARGRGRGDGARPLDRARRLRQPRQSGRGHPVRVCGKPSLRSDPDLVGIASKRLRRCSAAVRARGSAPRSTSA